MVNIVSLSSLRRDEANNDEHTEPNQYYAGGAGRGGGSGLSVLGPDGQTSDHIANIIARAQAATRDNESLASNVQPRHIITFYREGFTVNDGPYRPRDDPANRPFLEAIERGVVPAELERENMTHHVDISLIDKRQQDYQAPAAPLYTAFSGQGQTMGSATYHEDTVFQAKKVSAADRPVVNDKEPTTTIQIRLHNGTRLRETLNLTHTIGDIHTIIHLNEAVDRPYTMLAGFPPRPISTVLTQTIEEAGLKGASLTQKLA